MSQWQALLALTFKRHAATVTFIAGWTGVLICITSMLRGIPHPILLAISMPAVAQWIVLVAQVSYPQADLTATGSGYPEFLLRLPMSTRSLALWPMLATMAGSLGLWLALVYGYFARVGIPVAVGLTCGIVASGVGAVFVISSRPFYHGVLRLLGLGAALTAIVGLGVWLDPPVGVYVGLAVMEVGLSIGSVRLARQNVSIASRSARLFGIRNVRPFSSPAEAMFWMEWRLRGRTLPITVASFAVILSIPLAFMGGVPGVLAGHVTVNGWIPLGLPVLVLGTVGIGMLMRPDATMAVHDRSAFFMTLPVTNSEILNSKRKEQSVGAFLAMAVVLVALLGWLLLPPEPLWALLRTEPRQLLSTGLGGVLLIGLLWRSRTVWTFAACCHDETRSRVISMGAMALPVVTMLPIGIALDAGFTLSRFLSVLPWVLAANLALRAWLAYRIVHRLASLSPIEGAACCRYVAQWALAAILVWVLLVWLLRLQPVGYRSLVSDPTLVALLVASMAVPLIRPLLARQYLYAARHG